MPSPASKIRVAYALAPVWLVVGSARAQAPAPIVSPEVHGDGRVTFRMRAPGAAAVMLEREGARPQPMTKDAEGVWSLTSEALEPDLYGYTFVADGVSLTD